MFMINKCLLNLELHSAGQGSSVSCSANILYSHRMQNEVMCITIVYLQMGCMEKIAFP